MRSESLYAANAALPSRTKRTGPREGRSSGRKGSCHKKSDGAPISPSLHCDIKTSTATLAAFEAVARLGSLSAAAAALDLTAGAISRKIALLEEQLGVPLVVRTNKGVSLTEKGKGYAEKARKIDIRLRPAASLAFRSQRCVRKTSLTRQSWRTPGRRQISIPTTGWLQPMPLCHDTSQMLFFPGFEAGSGLSLPIGPREGYVEPQCHSSEPVDRQADRRSCGPQRPAASFTSTVLLQMRTHQRSRADPPTLVSSASS
ncbi:LysR family transcriptional regulator [Mesorhizobium sp. M1A.F.Ca.IN.022.04.1.1]|uniref:LysR family transcriptional regulator n=1 Tax=unclassified Mesorhizobium TaxID=325217 RepID=UPI0013DFC9B0